MWQEAWGSRFNFIFLHNDNKLSKNIYYTIKLKTFLLICNIVYQWFIIWICLLLYFRPFAFIISTNLFGAFSLKNVLFYRLQVSIINIWKSAVRQIYHPFTLICLSVWQLFKFFLSFVVLVKANNGISLDQGMGK
jgi:hypothetical protein